MATLSLPGRCADQVQPESSAGVRYVARQPILDLRGRLHGYELLFRNGAEAAFCGDGDLATRTMLDNSVIFGLERLAGGVTAFVNCTRESLTEDLVHVLPPSMTVLEILETIEPAPDVIRACRRLKASGFRVALDDFVWRPGIEPLIEFADYIKVDFVQTGAKERKKLLQRLSGYAVALVAEKVETQDEYQQAKEEGFTLIQGYYFCRPILMKNRKVPANRVSHIEILRMLHDDSIDLRKLSWLVKRDASLTYRLLRLINSPLCAVRQEVCSVRGALIAVGEDVFRRIATLAITSELNADQHVEVLRMAFVRARFCELAARLYGLNPTEQYLLGLLSLLPAMLKIPIEELASELPVRDEIRQALQGADLPEGSLLTWLVNHEHGAWAASDAIADARELEPEQLQNCYTDAVAWAESALNSA
jgi:EAL and modified HD-GYP domain-containing signal transduction protein